MHHDGPMRLVGAALLLVLSGAVALADDAKPADAKPTEARAKVPLRVVRMLPEAHQALLFDRTRGTYVVVEAGQTVEGLTVDAVDDDEVTLLSDAGALVVLAAPAPARHRRAAGSGKAADADTAADDVPAAPAKAPTTAKADPQPADPYAATPGEPQPADPYADPIAVVDATTALGTGKDGVRVVEAPAAAPAPVPVVAAAPAPAPVVAAAPAPVPTPARAARPASRGADDGAALAAIMTGSPAPATPAVATTTTTGPTVLARADVSAALGNFTTLSSSIRGGFTAGGLRIDSVAAGSVFAKAGLRAGDVVASVDGHALRSLDDAAELYARAPAARAMTASVLRGGKPVTLRVSIQ